MKQLEIMGVLFAAVGFGLLSNGVYLIGFSCGLFSCSLLIPYFYENKQNFLLLLQGYFAIMNLMGIYNNWG